jgi:hypothetical protein
MNPKTPKRKRATEWKSARLTIDVSAHVFAILTDFQKRYMSKRANAADAASSLLRTALVDYGNLHARSRQVEKYCKAEGIENQGEYVDSILQRKFPRGRIPKAMTAK